MSILYLIANFYHRQYKLNRLHLIGIIQELERHFHRKCQAWIQVIFYLSFSLIFQWCILCTWDVLCLRLKISCTCCPYGLYHVDCVCVCVCVWLVDLLLTTNENWNENLILTWDLLTSKSNVWLASWWEIHPDESPMSTISSLISLIYPNLWICW